MSTEQHPLSFIFARVWLRCLLLLVLGLLSVAIIIPAPSVTLSSQMQSPMQIDFLSSAVLSTARVLVGAFIALAISSLISIALILITLRLALAIFPLALLLGLTPPPIWSTLALLTFGHSASTPIVSIVLSVIFMLIAVQIFLLLSVRVEYLEISKAFRATRMRHARYVLLPESRDGMLLCIRLCLVVAWIAVTSAEGTGVSTGLGAVLLHGRALFDWAIVMGAWLGILTAAVFTDTISLLVLTSRIGLAK